MNRLSHPNRVSKPARVLVAALAAVALASCSSDRIGTKREVDIVRFLENVLGGESDSAQMDVFPGAVVVSSSVNERLDLEVVNPTIDTGPNHNNGVHVPEGNVDILVRPFIVRGADGIYLGGLPDGSTRLSDMRWVLLRKDVAAQFDVWTRSKADGPIRYSSSTGLSESDSVEVAVHTGEDGNLTVNLATTPHKTVGTLARIADDYEATIAYLKDHNFNYLDNVGVDSFPATYEVG